MLKTSLIVPVYNEAEYIPKLVQSIKDSSAILDIDRTTLWRKIKQYGLK